MSPFWLKVFILLATQHFSYDYITLHIDVELKNNIFRKKNSDLMIFIGEYTYAENILIIMNIFFKAECKHI